MNLRNGRIVQLDAIHCNDLFHYSYVSFLSVHLLISYAMNNNILGLQDTGQYLAVSKEMLACPPPILKVTQFFLSFFIFFEALVPRVIESTGITLG